MKVIRKKDETCDHIQFEIIATSGSLFGSTHKDFEVIEDALSCIEPLVDSRILCDVIII